MRRIPFLLLTVLLCCLLTGALAGSADRTGFWHPADNADIDYEDPDAEWSFSRCRETEHFYIFWASEFGADPGADSVPEAMRVDIDDLAEKLEQFYQTETGTLHFPATPWKLQVYLKYQEEWLATGSGYDNKIGALWINPQTCQPVGSTIAHEVGHCFQYLVYCDQLESGAADDSTSGFRYSYGGGNGNAFWELCAQWQSWQDYPAETFTDYEMDTWFSNYFRAFENEWTRYQNYWIIDRLTELQGPDCLENLWSQSRADEDALSCYARLYLKGDPAALYDLLYDYASRCATFDFDQARNFADDWQGYYGTELLDTGDGWLQVAYASCPEIGGFNAVPIGAEPGQDLTVTLEGLDAGSALASGDPGLARVGEDGTQTVSVSAYNDTGTVPDWRCGFAVLCGDGSRVYTEMQSGRECTCTLTVPDNARLVYFVVSGASAAYVPHIWDEDERTDAQAPYRIRIE